MSILTENWHTWHIGGVDSKSGLRFLKFRPQNLFLGKFGSKDSKSFVLSENWSHSMPRILIPNPDLDFWNFDPKIHFWANLSPKIQSCPFYLKIGTHGTSRMLILIPTLVFWTSNPKFLFGQIWVKKVKVVCLSWKLAYMISRGCGFLFRH